MTDATYHALPAIVEPALHVTLEEWASLAVFWVITMVVLGQWVVMTFLWPSSKPEWAVWSKTTAFLLVLVARMVLYYTGWDRYPFPWGLIINLVTLGLLLFFSYIYLWRT